MDVNDNFARFEGWAPTRTVLAERRALANELVGQTLAAVRYINIDYLVMETPELQVKGPRVVASADEWIEPPWDFGTIHSVDFGIELETSGGGIFAVGWDLPGTAESMFVGRGPFIPLRLVPDAGVAIWDVTESAPWLAAAGFPIMGLDLNYEHWEAGNEKSGYWCTGLVMIIGDHRIEVVLGEASSPGILRPSADNIAVLLEPTGRPIIEGGADEG